MSYRLKTLLKGGHIGDYIGEYCRGYLLRRILGVQTISRIGSCQVGFIKPMQLWKYFSSQSMRRCFLFLLRCSISERTYEYGTCIRGPQYRPQNTIILHIGTPKLATLMLGNSRIILPDSTIKKASTLEDKASGDYIRRENVPMWYLRRVVDGSALD